MGVDWEWLLDAEGADLADAYNDALPDPLDSDGEPYVHPYWDDDVHGDPNEVFPEEDLYDDEMDFPCECDDDGTIPEDVNADIDTEPPEGDEKADPAATCQSEAHTIRGSTP